METGLTTQNQKLLNLDMDGMKTIGQVFIDSGVFADTKDMSQAMVKILAGQELSLPPLYSMQNFHLLTTGYGDKQVTKIAQSASSMALLLKRTGNYTWKVKQSTELICEIQFFEMIGAKWEDAYTSIFRIEDADRAGLMHYVKEGKKIAKAGSAWFKWPKAMLFNRAMSQGARVVAPHLLGGVPYTKEEVQDTMDITPEAVLEEAPPPPPDEVKEKKTRKKKEEVVEKLDRRSEEQIVDSETGEVTNNPEAFEDIKEPDGPVEKQLEGGAIEPEDLPFEQVDYGIIKSPKEVADAKAATLPEPLPPPTDPHSLTNGTEVCRVAFTDFHYQPKDVYKILDVKSSGGLDKNYKAADAYIKIWEHYQVESRA